jgi:hypothetical protein
MARSRTAQSYQDRDTGKECSQILEFAMYTHQSTAWVRRRRMARFVPKRRNKGEGEAECLAKVKTDKSAALTLRYQAPMPEKQRRWRHEAENFCAPVGRPSALRTRLSTSEHRASIGSYVASV